MQSCYHCNCFNLVWDWHDGDIVCTSCGTVNQERFIDDNCFYKDYENHDYKEPKLVNKKVDNVVSTINTIFFNGMIDDTSRITDKIQNSNEIDNNKISKADIVACVYDNEKGLTSKELCINMNIKPNKFWKSVKKDIIWEHRLLDIIKRLVYSCYDIDAKQHWTVIKCARNIIDRIKYSTELQNIKPDKFAISLIYVACQCEKVMFNKKDFIKIFGISNETLKKHEHIIQTILEK